MYLTILVISSLATHRDLLTERLFDCEIAKKDARKRMDLL